MTYNRDETVESQSLYYKPKNKAEREARRRIWDRYRAMRDDPIRKEEEKHWENADKAYQQWVPEREEGDWRSHLTLPDSFAAVQSHMQETIDRRGRPLLASVESSDLAREQFSNDIMSYSMDRTGFDYETFKAKNCAAIRGTAFVMERYRLEKRKVKDPTSVNEDGSLEYTEREIVDKDDTFTEHAENDTIYIDPAASHEDKARDMIERELVDWDEFQRTYKQRGDFMNISKVSKAGKLNEKALFFQKAVDMSDNDVEILHYYNRATDSYDVLANNVLIRMGPIPYKHKELPVAVYRHYLIPGRIYGMGIPRVIFSLSEERKSLRNLQLDRQHMQINKMFLVNDLVDIDDEDLRTRPNGFIPVNTNGMNISQVIQPLEYGDTPMSYYRSEEQLLEDIRRAHGIDDRVQGVQAGGTATEAAILKEAAQKRINMINLLSDTDTLVRIGRLKWSNIQFFYKVPRIEKVTKENEEREKKVYRKIKVEGREYTINKENGGNTLDTTEIEGSSGFTLDKTMARYMEGDFDVVVKGDASVVLSKPLMQAKITEMFGLLALNPTLQATLDPDKAVRRYLQINDEDPKLWMRGKGLTTEQWRRIAISENDVMASGIPLLPTEGATQEHTEEHLNYMDSVAFSQLPQAIQKIVADHAFAEAESQGMMPQGGSGSGQQGMPGSNMPPQGGIDIQPNTPGGAEQQNQAVDQMAQR
jgi:hypothetical protein